MFMKCVDEGKFDAHEMLQAAIKHLEHNARSFEVGSIVVSPIYPPEYIEKITPVEIALLRQDAEHLRILDELLSLNPIQGNCAKD